MYRNINACVYVHICAHMLYMLHKITTLTLVHNTLMYTYMYTRAHLYTIAHTYL